MYAIVAYLKHNTEDIKTDPRKPQKHKGLVLTLLSALTQLTHASLRIPVRMPLISCPELRGRHQAQKISPQRLAQPHPYGHSAVIKFKQ